MHGQISYSSLDRLQLKKMKNAINIKLQLGIIISICVLYHLVRTWHGQRSGNVSNSNTFDIIVISIPFAKQFCGHNCVCVCVGGGVCKAITCKMPQEYRYVSKGMASEF